jgi:hypothetical protein
MLAGSELRATSLVVADDRAIHHGLPARRPAKTAEVAATIPARPDYGVVA